MTEETKQTAASEESELVRVVTLRKPITFEGKPINEIRMDFSSINGAVLRDIEKQFIVGGSVAQGTVINSDEWGAYVAARAANLPIEALDALDGRDYLEVALTAKTFFVE